MRDDDESYSHEWHSSRAAEIGLYPGMPEAEMDRLVKEDAARNAARFAAAPPTWPEDPGAFCPVEAHRAELEADAALVVEIDGPPVMLDHEAYAILKRISAVQAELADVDANAKTMKAQAVSDLRDYLGNFDRLERLERWHASKLRGKRRSVATLCGSVGKKTVPARCIVADRGLALEWLKEHAPEAVTEQIVTAKLPKPVEGYDEHGEIAWKAPGLGLSAEPEREEVLVNNRQLSTLLKGATEDPSDE